MKALLIFPFVPRDMFCPDPPGSTGPIFWSPAPFSLWYPLLPYSLLARPCSLLHSHYPPVPPPSSLLPYCSSLIPSPPPSASASSLIYSAFSLCSCPSSLFSPPSSCFPPPPPLSYYSFLLIIPPPFFLLFLLSPLSSFIPSPLTKRFYKIFLIAFWEGNKMWYLNLLLNISMVIDCNTFGCPHPLPPIKV